MGQAKLKQTKKQAASSDAILFYLCESSCFACLDAFPAEAALSQSPDTFRIIREPPKKTNAF